MRRYTSQIATLVAPSITHLMAPRSIPSWVTLPTDPSADQRWSRQWRRWGESALSDDLSPGCAPCVDVVHTGSTRLGVAKMDSERST